MAVGGVTRLKPRSANRARTHIHEKTQTAARSLIYFPSFTSIPGIL